MSCWVVEKCCVVLCNLKSIGNSGFGGGLGWFLEAVCSDSWVWRRSGEVWEVGSVAIPGFGGLGWVWEAVCSDSWVWRRFEEVGLGEGLGRSGRLVLEAVCSDSWVWRRSGRWVWEEVWEAVCSDSWVWRRWSGRWVWGDRT